MKKVWENDVISQRFNSGDGDYIKIYNTGKMFHVVYRDVHLVGMTDDFGNTSVDAYAAGRSLRKDIIKKVRHLSAHPRDEMAWRWVIIALKGKNTVMYWDKYYRPIANHLMAV